MTTRGGTFSGARFVELADWGGGVSVRSRAAPATTGELTGIWLVEPA